MAFSYNKKNLANTTITGAITPTQTSVTVADATVFSYAFFYATLMPSNEMSNASNSEIVLVTNIQGNTLTLVRGQENTIARSFPYGAVITNGIYTRDIDYARSIGRKVFMARDDGTDDTNTSYQIIDPMIKNVPEEGSIITVEFDTPSYGAPTLGVNNGVGGLVQVSGTDIHITDSSGQIDSVEMYGDTEQTTYSGKNLLNITKGTFTQNGITFTQNPDGSVTMNGTSTGNAYYEMNNTAASQITITSGVRYTLSIGDVTLPSGQVIVQIRKVNPNTIYAAVSDKSSSFTAPETTTTFTYIGVYGSGVTLNNVTIYPMLEVGSSMTSFEPYVGGTASPNPDYPQEVQTVTGEQTITISDGQGQSQSYSVNLGDIELCKIGTYQDYIYKSGNDWYLHKETNKINLDGSTEGTWWYESESGHERFIVSYADIATQSPYAANTPKIQYSNYFEGSNGYHTYTGDMNNIMSGHHNNHQIIIRATQFTSLAAFTSWLGTNKPSMYYVKTTPTDTQITNATLTAQLNALYNMLPEGVADVVVTGDLPGSLTIKYYQQGTGTYTAPIVGGAEIDGGDNEQVVELDSYLPYRLVYDTNGYWRVLNKGPKVTTGAIADGAVTAAKITRDNINYGTTSSDIRIGTFDGDPLYRKVETFENLPRGFSQHNFTNDIANLKAIIRIDGSYNSSGTWIPVNSLPPDNTAGYGIAVRDVTYHKWAVVLGTSMATTNNGYVIIDYTKTS